MIEVTPTAELPAISSENWVLPSTIARRQMSRGSELDELIATKLPPVSRRRLRFRAYYEGADEDRFVGHDWMVQEISPDAALRQNIAVLRRRANDLARNDQTVHHVIENRVVQIVGPSIIPEPMIDREELALSEAQAAIVNNELRKVWEEFAEASDPAGEVSFWRQQKMTQRNCDNDGGVLWLLRYGTDRDARPVTLQVISIERLSTPPSKAGDRLVRAGIEHDAAGNRIAYWIRTAMPGDDKSFAEQWQRVPANMPNGLPQVIHIYDQLEPEMTLGEPLAAASLWRQKDVHDFWDAEIDAKYSESCFTGFVTTKGSALQMAQSNANLTDNRGRRIEDMSPGKFVYLDPGQEITFGDPKRPGATFAPFMRFAALGVSQGMNWPYEWTTNDYSQSNYSVSRMSAIDGGRIIDDRQKLLIDMGLRRVYRAVVHMAVLTGRLRRIGLMPTRYLENPRAWGKCDWIGTPRPYIDPPHEIPAATHAIDHHMTTLTAEVRRRYGKSLVDTLVQRRQELDLLAALKIGELAAETAGVRSGASPSSVPTGSTAIPRPNRESA